MQYCEKISPCVKAYHITLSIFDVSVALLNICVPFFLLLSLSLRTFQGSNRNQIVGAVGFGKQRPGKPEDSLIPELQMVIATCWKENPNERMKPLNLLSILNGSKAELVKKEKDQEDTEKKQEELKEEEEGGKEDDEGEGYGESETGIVSGRLSASVDESGLEAD